MTDSFSATSSSTSYSLIQRARSRDSGAWQRLARLYAPMVYGWARQAGLDSNDATDIVQEVFQAVLTNLERFRHDQENSSFRGWLWTIARNQVRLHYRRMGTRPGAAGGSGNQMQLQRLPDLIAEDSDPPEDGNKSLVHRALQLVRNDFEEKTWQAFWRLTVEGHSAREIGEDLGMNAKSVRQAKYRILTRLREELADR